MQFFTPKIPLFIPIDRDNIYLSDIAQSTVVPEIQNDLIPKATTLATQISSYLDELNPHNYPRGGRS